MTLFYDTRLFVECRSSQEVLKDLNTQLDVVVNNNNNNVNNIIVKCSIIIIISLHTI